MNKRSVRWWLIAAASVCCAAVPASVNSALADGPRSARASDIDLSDPDVEAIVELADRFPEAIASGDLARVQDFYTQDVIYMAQGMHDTAGRENVWAGDFLKVNIVHVEVHLQEVKVFGDMAFDRAVFTTTVVPRAGGRVRSFSGRLLEILKKQSGLWKSYRVMVNSA